MGILISRSGDTVVAKLEGEIDHHCAERLRNKLDAAIADSDVSELIMDLGGVVFMDSSGLGVVLGRYRKLASRGGRIRIINATKRVERILRMGGIYTLIERNDRRIKYE